MRRLLGFVLMAAALAWAGPAVGQDYSFGGNNGNYSSGASAGSGGGGTGLYLAPRFLDSLTNTGDISGGGDRGSKTYNTVGGAIALGYYLSRLDSRIPLRVELEYAARSNVNASWDRSFNTGTDKFKALFNVQTLQANLYWDIDTGTAFTPFIGAGAGLSFIYADYQVENRNSISEYTTGFAWNAGAGVSYAITEMFNVDLAYRFAGFGYAEAHSDHSNPKNYMTANEFLLGMRVNF